MRCLTFPLCLLALALSLRAQDPVPKPDPAPKPTPKPEATEPREPTPIGLGESLPKGLTLRAIDGTQHQLDDLKGKVVVFHFWSTTCPYEEAAEPKLNALAAEFAGQDVVVLGIAANAGEIGEQPKPEAFDTKEVADRPYGKLREKAKASQVNHTILVDHGGDTLGKRLDGKTTPHCFVFDQEGKLRYSGALDDDPHGEKETPIRYVAGAVLALLEGKAPPLATTKPYG